MNATSYALRLLKRRLYAREELAASMRRRSIPEEEITSALLELERIGLIDDKRFAKAYIHDRDRFKPTGDMRLKQELMQKGVSKEIIQSEILNRVQDEGEAIDQKDLARQAMSSRQRLYANLATDVRKRRLFSYLARRGFSSNVIWSVINED